MTNHLILETVTDKEISAALDIEGGITPILQGSKNLSYFPLTVEERDQVILTVLQTLENSTLQKAGEHRHAIWELAWKTQSEKFSNECFARKSLVPDFMNATPIVRFRQQYVRPQSPEFEHGIFDIFRSWIFKTYCMDAPVLYEFGCGSGFNLVALSDINPHIRMVGLDWAEHSCELVHDISTAHRLQLESRQFNFFAPDDNLGLDPQGIALTICALEQVGERFMPFLEYLLRQKPKLCIHIEPIYEFYEPSNLLDYLAMQYHVKRNYLRGFWPCLRELESQGRILIHKARRLSFGSLFHEAYNYVIWEPL